MTVLGQGTKKGKSNQTPIEQQKHKHRMQYKDLCASGIVIICVDTKPHIRWGPGLLRRHIFLSQTRLALQARRWLLLSTGFLDLAKQLCLQ